MIIQYTKAEHIKDLCYYEEVFAEIENENFENSTYEAMRKKIEKDKQIPLLQMFRPHANFKSQTFYRIRKASEFKEDKSLSCSFGPPPKEFTKIGRANLSGYPVLYLAFLPQTACRELDISINEEVFLCEWKFIESNLGGIFYIGESNYMDVSWEQTIQKENEIFNKKLRSYSRETSESLKYIKNKLSSWFLRDNRSLSSFLGHYFLYDTNLSNYSYPVDFIIYPSVADSYKGANFALASKSINKIELTLVYRAIVNEITDQGVSLTRIEVGKNIGDKIKWMACKN